MSLNRDFRICCLLESIWVNLGFELLVSLKCGQYFLTTFDCAHFLLNLSRHWTDKFIRISGRSICRNNRQAKLIHILGYSICRNIIQPNLFMFSAAQFFEMFNNQIFSKYCFAQFIHVFNVQFLEIFNSHISSRF